MRRECVCKSCNATHLVPPSMGAVDNVTLDRCPFKKACFKLELSTSLVMYTKSMTAQASVMDKVTSTFGWTPVEVEKLGEAQFREEQIEKAVKAWLADPRVARFVPKHEGTNYHLDLSQMVDGEVLGFGCLDIPTPANENFCPLPSVKGLPFAMPSKVKCFTVVRKGDKFSVTWEKSERMVSFVYMFCLLCVELMKQNLASPGRK